MIVRYSPALRAVRYEGEVIGNPIYKDFCQKMFFLIKMQDGHFREVECEDCREIKEYSKEAE